MDSSEKLRVKSAHVNSEATRLLRLADQISEMEKVARVLRDPAASGQLVALTNGKIDMNARCDFIWLTMGTRAEIALHIDAAIAKMLSEESDG